MNEIKRVLYRVVMLLTGPLAVGTVIGLLALFTLVLLL
jgi:hypothetical protein